MRMKKWIALFCVFCLMSGIPVRTNSEENKDKRIILIDPGHGGIDGGAKSKSGTIEKDINLSISLKLKKELEDAGYAVYMTREGDSQLDAKKVKDLNVRCQMKKDVKCDAFISIHQNMFPQSNCFGSQVWYSSNEISKSLAENIQASLKETINDNNKRVPKAAKEQYRILRDGYEGACVLVECGFLSNYEEEQKLKSDEHQDKIAKGITAGINKYFESKDS
ncbi:N-acetylmuramoyl-L-alanine amidase CwlD [Clostridium beijerinckii]|uniref:N-acetylmuramoyl-L-alanine amidase AmiC n=1 Tax=Clostridium beijerinckii TaxID=1520 RepID=A0A1S8SFD1_CLOBE|nr:N-acetylmuramoyl-L-alanine amidase CwlD [Clostridium beijerinckii]NRY61157.1 N-acetylmuramoyl-L-alanine amidase [Clostridium beijerinckii]OOM64300.1 N-acetylmuramoyl-L-alanine amidase AmiC precursor [Clostridium beijerinckii]